LHDPDARKLIRKVLIVPESSNHDFADVIISCGSIDPDLLDGLGSVDVSRIAALLALKLSESTHSPVPTFLNHPIPFLSAMIGRFGQDKVLAMFPAQVGLILDRYRSESSLLAAISLPGPIRDKYLEKFKSQAGSSTFDYANAAAQILNQFDATIGSQLEPATAFEVLLDITRAAEWGAFGSQRLLNTQFSEAPNLRKRCRAYLDSNSAEAELKFNAMGLRISFADWSAMF
jgi:hypothetical protein